MSTNNPMTEGEALAVDAVAKAIADVVGHGMSEKCEAQARAAIAALTAHTAASGGEAKGDRLAIRMLVAAGFVTEAKANEALRIAHGFEHGPLAPPPAAVPADALERLVEKWRSDRSDYGHYYIKVALALCASELAALIPKGAE